MIVLQHVNSNYGIKTVTRISPCHFAYILPKFCDLLLLLVDCTGCRIQGITIMFWLKVDMRLHFHFAANDLFLIGARAFRSHMSRQNGMSKIKEMPVKLSWSVL